MPAATASLKIDALLRTGLLLGLALGPFHATRGAEPEKNRGNSQSWTFESDEPGKPAKGLAAEVGTWEVAKDGDNRVLSQKAKNEDATFNIALAQATSYRDLDLSVRVKAVAGAIDQGGGPVWRAKDKNNYYVCRYNPLEDNFRLYKVENGKRTQFATAKVAGDTQWHTLRVRMTGANITCEFDGKPLLHAQDTTFPDAGRVGLWSKADAQSYFDDLTVAP